MIQHSKLKVYQNKSSNQMLHFGCDEENAVENAPVNFIRNDITQHPSHRKWFEQLWNESENCSAKYKKAFFSSAANNPGFSSIQSNLGYKNAVRHPYILE